jgi:hypothetical protein
MVRVWYASISTKIWGYSMNPTHSDYITLVRQATKDLLAVLDRLRALSRQSTALDLPNALADGERLATPPTFGDFAGANSHLATADITAVIGTTLPAIEALLAAGHATNLYKVA